MQVRLDVLAPLDRVLELPALPEGFDGWRRAMDTARPSPEDILPPREAPRVEEDTYRAAPRSVVALFAFRMPR